MLKFSVSLKKKNLKITSLSTAVESGPVRGRRREIWAFDSAKAWNSYLSISLAPYFPCEGRQTSKLRPISVMAGRRRSRINVPTWSKNGRPTRRRVRRTTSVRPRRERDTDSTRARTVRTRWPGRLLLCWCRAIVRPRCRRTTEPNRTGTRSGGDAPRSGWSSTSERCTPSEPPVREREALAWGEPSTAGPPRPGHSVPERSRVPLCCCARLSFSNK